MIQVGVVGAGFRSRLATAAEVPGTSRVVAVADVDEQAARRAVAERHPGADTYTDHRALLDRADVDAVLLITPDHTHADLACAALQAGKAVFVEKPLATTVEDCDRVLRVARETGSRLYVGHNMRHMPVVQIMPSSGMSVGFKSQTFLPCGSTSTTRLSMPQETRVFPLGNR